MLICLLACYLIWHLRKAWAPLTFTDENPHSATTPWRPRTLPGRPRQGLQQTRPNGNPVRSFRGLLDHLGTLTRNRIRYHDTDIEIDKLTDATPEQRRAFELIDATIPLTIAA